MLNIYEIADKYVRDKYKYLSKRSWKNEMAYDKALFIKAAELVQKEYEEKLRWIPIDKLENPTIPFLGKDKFGKIELFKVANVFYLKAMDIVEWRSIL